MPKAMTIAEAKAHFSECVKSAEGGETVLITRYGRTAAAVVSAKYLTDLETAASRKAAPQGLGALVGRFADGDELVSELEQAVRARGAPRKAPRLG